MTTLGLVWNMGEEKVIFFRLCLEIGTWGNERKVRENIV